MKATIRDWAPEIGLCRECMAEALLSDQTGATNWLRHPTTPREHDQLDWPTVVATRLAYREAASWHPYQERTADEPPPQVSGRADPHR
jgi:hypothetical protein